MNILIQGQAILAIDVTEGADAITSTDGVYPKHVIPGWQIVDAEIPAGYAPGKYIYSEGAVVLRPDTAAEIAAAVSPAILQIDADTDAIYGAVLGNRAQEYLLAKAQAQAYKDAGYTSTVPHCVQCWATPNSWTATQSADDILATASAWEGAMDAIREHRLAAKVAVRAAVDVTGVTAAMATWAGFVTAIRGQLGLST